ncbi:peptidoglycan-binding domain-containing protein [Floridanema aerugineum]|uniref:Peptidoglycan-binding protein n=1 Tax=Floridaenema aerugineum BLCC-F46 TaxID=3153654 RepID=A0ABV4X0P7_9CYAN
MSLHWKFSEVIKPVICLWRSHLCNNKFQKDYGLVVDDIVAPKTWSTLEYQIHD